jgi:hypothetical protein
MSEVALGGTAKCLPLARAHEKPVTVLAPGIPYLYMIRRYLNLVLLLEYEQ